MVCPGHWLPLLRENPGRYFCSIASAVRAPATAGNRFTGSHYRDSIAYGADVNSIDKTEASASILPMNRFIGSRGIITGIIAATRRLLS